MDIRGLGKTLKRACVTLVIAGVVVWVMAGVYGGIKTTYENKGRSSYTASQVFRQGDKCRVSANVWVYCDDYPERDYSNGPDPYLHY